MNEVKERKSLWEISNDLLDALDSLEVDPDTGEVLNFDELNAAQMSFDSKAENVALYIKNLQCLSDGIKAERDSLKTRQEHVDKKISSLKGYLTECFDEAGKTSLETARTKISFRRSTSVKIVDETKIPKKYYKKKIEYYLSKLDVKAAIQSGIKVKGAELAESRNIQIK